MTLNRLFIGILCGFLFLPFTSIAFEGITSPQVDFLESKGVFTSEERSESFQGYRSITRGDFIMWLVKYGTEDTSSNIGISVFSDTDNTNLSPYIESLYFSGALNDFTQIDQFFPRKKLTRLQAVKMLFQHMGVSSFHPNFLVADASWLNLPNHMQDKAYMVAALENKYILPIDKNNSGYDQNITRDEVAYMLWRHSSESAPSLTITLDSQSNGDTQSDIERVVDLIESQYFYNDEIEEDQLNDAALTAIIESLDDPYSTYLPPEESEAFVDSVTKNNFEAGESYGGIGTAITMANEGGILITEIFDGAPAEDANLIVGDIITHVDGTDIRTFSATEAAKLIRGIIGTNVNLKVSRNGRSVETSVTRGTVDLTGYSTVNAHIQENVLWIRVRSFKSFTANEFSAVLEGHDLKSLDGIVIDLRYNSGGIMSIAQKMLGEVLEEGDLALRYYTNKSEDLLEVLGEGTYSDIPLVVFQNEYSASASELFSAAIKDYERGTIIGKTSFGKGVAQRLFELQRGSIKLTTAEFTSPLQNTIHNTGVVPDIYITGQSDNDYFTEAKKILN